MRAHGTHTCFVWGTEPGCIPGRGCRCDECRAANSAYERERKQRTEPAYVGAEPVREHLAYLSSHGVGWKTVARAGGLSPSTVWKILYGAPGRGPSKRVRKATADALLSVTLDAGRPGSLIDAAPTWETISTLLGRGWTKRAIAQAIGTGDENGLQLRRTTITRANAAKIRALLDEPVPDTVGKAWSSRYQANAEPAEVERPRYDLRDNVTLRLVELLEARIDENHWRRDAACRSRPVYLFFPARGDHQTLAAAKKICGACFVRAECLQANLDERDGVYGGLSGHERRTLREGAAS